MKYILYSIPYAIQHICYFIYNLKVLPYTFKQYIDDVDNYEYYD